MPFFLLTILAYNAYNWWRLRNAFLRGQSPWWSILLFACILFLAMFPVTCRLCFGRHGGTGWLADICTIISWTWLAWSFWLATAFLILDAVNLLGYLTCICCHHSFRYAIPPKWCGCLAIGFVILSSIWGLVEASCIRLQNIEITSPKIPAEADGYRVALVSDIHLSPCLRRSVINKTVKLLKEAQPDLLLNAGDFLDGSGEREASLARLFLDVPVAQRFSVLGNHEVYSGVKESLSIHEEAGFKWLLDTGLVVNGWLYLYGVQDDAVHGRHSMSKLSAATPPYDRDDIREAMQNRFSILLKHRPEPSEAAKHQFDLMLSGHSHGGQLFPFNLLVKTKYKLGTGLKSLPNSKLLLYTTPGTGTWGPPFRVFARPEVSLFTFRHQTALPVTK